MSLKVKVSRQHTSTHQFLLQDIHEVQQILRLPTTDVINSIGRDGQAILTLLSGRWSLHHSPHTLYDVINIGEVTTAVAVVEDLDGLTLQQLIGKSEVRHIRTTSRTIYRKETKSRCRDIIQL